MFHAYPCVYEWFIPYYKFCLAPLGDRIILEMGIPGRS